MELWNMCNNMNTHVNDWPTIWKGMDDWARCRAPGVAYNNQERYMHRRPIRGKHGPCRSKLQQR
jgi:hypothetical protein